MCMRRLARYTLDSCHKTICMFTVNNNVVFGSIKGISFGVTVFYSRNVALFTCTIANGRLLIGSICTVFIHRLWILAGSR